MRTLSTILRNTLIVLLALSPFLSFAQESGSEGRGRPNLQSRLKRIFVITDQQSQTGNRVEYESREKVSLRSSIDNVVVFSGIDAQLDSTSKTVARGFLHVIDPIAVPKTSTSTVDADSVVEVLAERIISDVPEKKFSVFPNPVENTQNAITLNFEGMTQGSQIQLSLYDQRGRVLAHESFKLSGTNHEMAMPRLNSGSYIIQVHSDSTRFSKKLMVR